MVSTGERKKGNVAISTGEDTRCTTRQQPKKISNCSMADEEKKPRHRLGADELLEEVQAAVAKIINLLESNGLAEESVEHLVSLVKGLDFMGTLDLSKRLGLSMPDVPHEELVASLLDAWDCVVYKTGHTRKQMYRKVRVLEADNKTDPDVLERWKGEREKAERESAKANVAYVTIREIVKSFKVGTEEQRHQPEPSIKAS